MVSAGGPSRALGPQHCLTGPLIGLRAWRSIAGAAASSVGRQSLPVPSVGPKARYAMAETSIDFGQLAKISVETRKYRAGQSIFKKGDVGFELLVIRQGEVELRVDDRVLRTLAT